MLCSRNLAVSTLLDASLVSSMDLDPFMLVINGTYVILHTAVVINIILLSSVSSVHHCCCIMSNQALYATRCLIRSTFDG